MALVGAGDGNAGHGIAEALPLGAVTHGVVARVFVQEGGQDPGGLIGAVGLVEEAAPEVSPEDGVAAVAGVEGGMRVLPVGGGGGEAEEDEGGVVEGLTCGDFEALFEAGRRRDLPAETLR